MRRFDSSCRLLFKCLIGRATIHLFADRACSTTTFEKDHGPDLVRLYLAGSILLPDDYCPVALLYLPVLLLVRSIPCLLSPPAGVLVGMSRLPKEIPESKGD